MMSECISNALERSTGNCDRRLSASKARILGMSGQCKPATDKAQQANLPCPHHQRCHTTMPLSGSQHRSTGLDLSEAVLQVLL